MFIILHIPFFSNNYYSFITMTRRISIQNGRHWYGKNEIRHIEKSKDLRNSPICNEQNNNERGCDDA